MKKYVIYSICSLIAFFGYWTYVRDRIHFPSKPDNTRLLMEQQYINKEQLRIRFLYLLYIEKGSGKLGFFRERSDWEEITYDLRKLGQFVEHYNFEVECYNGEVTNYISAVMRSCSGSQYRGVEKTFPKYLEPLDMEMITQAIAADSGCEQVNKCITWL